MVQRSRGARSKSRHIMRKSPRERGNPTVTKVLREFPEGTRVAVKIDPSSQRGVPHIRFQGLTGQVVGRQGHAHVVHLKDGGKLKTVIARAEHLRPVA
jgi:large subunit ribosomal protein L21e